eukprot:sb/3470936/
MMTPNSTMGIAPSPVMPNIVPSPQIVTPSAYCGMKPPTPNVKPLTPKTPQTMGMVTPSAQLTSPLSPPPPHIAPSPHHIAPSPHHIAAPSPHIAPSPQMNGVPSYNSPRPHVDVRSPATTAPGGGGDECQSIGLTHCRGARENCGQSIGLTGRMCVISKRERSYLGNSTSFPNFSTDDMSQSALDANCSDSLSI